MYQDIEIYIDGQRADVDTNTIISISDQIDNEGDFNLKRGVESFDIELPATPKNDAIFNAFGDPASEDMSGNNAFTNPRNAIIRAGGDEILSGKILLMSATHNTKPVKYTINIYGSNNDWSIGLKDNTLQDFVSSTPVLVNDDTVINSWDNFNGQSEDQDFVFAPVRYSTPFVDVDGNTSVTLQHLRPHLSIYWILYRMFKSQGYKIISNFLDSDFFRRLVLLWTYGNFFELDDQKYEALKFDVSTPDPTSRVEYGNSAEGVVPLNVTNTSTGGSYNNNNVYSWDDSTNRMVWTYPTSLGLGNVNIEFETKLLVAWALGSWSNLNIYTRYYVNGTLYKSTDIFSERAGFRLFSPDANSVGTVIDVIQEIDNLKPGDVVEMEVYVDLTRSIASDFIYLGLNMQSFSIKSFFLSVGQYRTISDYDKFQDYQALDLLRGLIDLFDLQISTDTFKKQVYIEPSHEYMTGNAQPQQGFYNGLIDWTDKQDLGKDSEATLYCDLPKNYYMSFQDDGADGGLKSVQDRNMTVIGMGAYIFPDRFQSSYAYRYASRNNDIGGLQNRFFAPTLHVSANEFIGISGIPPQFVCVIPNDISSASSLYADNTFMPKIAYYKGNVSGVGGWTYTRNDNGLKLNLTTLPYLFAVNYQPGGENDPVLSYSDQCINGKVVRGLLSNFFLPRLSIMNYGRQYKTYIRLNNSDVKNWLHKEYVALNGIKYQVISIEDYNPSLDESCTVTLWKVPPKTLDNINAIRPVKDNVLSSVTSGRPGDFLYWPHLVLNSDVIVRNDN